MNQVVFEKESHSYFHDGNRFPSVSELLDHFGYSNFNELRKFGLSNVLDRAADYGTVVHDTLRLYDEGELEEYDPLLVGEVSAWENFLSDFNKPEFLIIEEPLFSKVWGFGGTPDRYYLDNLVDIKTGAKQISHPIQTAFYKILIEENFQKLKVKNRFTVELKPDGYKIHQHKDRNDITIAKALCQIWHDKKRKGLINDRNNRD